ncbi:MAG: histidine kinase [Pseudomonadales bacterium]|jgi:signal transduction histidine kinase|nr:histidine kinase [Pseudomonadales bacterium]
MTTTQSTPGTALPPDAEARPRRRDAARAAARSWLETMPDLLRNQNTQFWALQLAGFMGWGLTSLATGLYWGMKPSYNLAVLTGIATGMLLTGVLREAFTAVWSRPLWIRFLVLVAGSYLVALLWQISKNVALYEFYGFYLEAEEKWRPQRWSDYTRGVMSSCYIVLCWFGLYFGIKYYRMLNEERARSLRAMSSAREAQLRMLRYQLNPHFLFNTLNAISTLILEQETQLANRMVTHLSSFLRHSLDTDPMARVPLEQEVKALSLYLEIEQVRFEDRLRLEQRITHAAARALVPSLLLQPLVENAIKYAIARSEDGGTIRLLADVVGDRLEVEVSDDGPGLPEDFELGRDARGVGLRNTADRLQQAYGDDHEFHLLAAEPSGLRVLIRLPFESQSGVSIPEAHEA